MRGPSDKKKFKEWLVDEERRIERQRTLFAMIPDSRAKDALKDAMLNRARDLLEYGMEGCEACDALLEFLPSADAEKMLNEHFAEDLS